MNINTTRIQNAFKRRQSYLGTTRPRNQNIMRYAFNSIITAQRDSTKKKSVAQLLIPYLRETEHREDLKKKFLEVHLTLSSIKDRLNFTIKKNHKRRE